MRGKRDSGCGAVQCLRLIPAHAGKTRLPALAVNDQRAHPRACGENCPFPGTSRNAGGSSPRMRGKRSVSTDQTDAGRLIPAHAGKTVWIGRSLLQYGAHPRACGENGNFARSFTKLYGSSPRMRGKLPSLKRVTLKLGLIPAHAGKTPYGKRLIAPRGAHPRACGENSWDIRHLKQHLGSSPRMRGKHLPVGAHAVELRLIPAHAGKTFSLRSSFHGNQAHPRACGENAAFKALDALDEGSSPRMRGKPNSFLPPPAAAGLIPAHAGKTFA